MISNRSQGLWNCHSIIPYNSHGDWIDQLHRFLRHGLVFQWLDNLQMWKVHEILPSSAVSVYPLFHRISPQFRLSTSNASLTAWWFPQTLAVSCTVLSLGLLCEPKHFFLNICQTHTEQYAILLQHTCSMKTLYFFIGRLTIFGYANSFIICI